MSLTEKQVLSGAEDLNITIKAYKDEDGKGRIVIRGAQLITRQFWCSSHCPVDTGIGMTPEELTTNLVCNAPQ